MPGLEEVRIYLRGLWLLMLGDPAGFGMLDLTPRGSLRSFWAAVWCLPSMILSCLSARANFLEAMPPETEAGGLFLFRVAMTEAIGWLFPLLLSGMVLAIAGYGNRFNALVTTTNWLSVPFSYATALMLLVVLLFPGMWGVIALPWLALVCVLLIALERIFRMICGDHTVLIVSLVLVQFVPAIFLSDWLSGFLGIATP